MRVEKASVCKPSSALVVIAMTSAQITPQVENAWKWNCSLEKGVTRDMEPAGPERGTHGWGEGEGRGLHRRQEAHSREVKVAVGAMHGAGRGSVWGEGGETVRPKLIRLSSSDSLLPGVSSPGSLTRGRSFRVF